MDFWSLLLSLCCGVAIFQSFFLGVYLLFTSRKWSVPKFFLSVMLLGLAFRIAKSYFYYLLGDFPEWGMVLGAAGLWTIGPAFYLYTRASQPAKISWLSYLHFLPPLLLLLITGLGGYWFGHTFTFGNLSMLFYLAYSCYLFYYQPWEGNSKQFKLFAGSMGLICFCFILGSHWGNIQIYTIGSAVASLVLYAINFVILKNPEYTRNGRANGKKKISSNQKDTVAKALATLFEEDKIYRRKGLTLAIVAEKMGIPSYQISQTINQHFDLKFNEFVNRYRVAEVKERLQDSTSNDKIEVIAQEVGFSGTSSLYTAFKKEVNLTPQAFRKQAQLRTSAD